MYEKCKTVIVVQTFIKSDTNNHFINANDVDGYLFEGNDSSQMAFRTFYSDRTSKVHKHELDEYPVCVCGQYTVFINGKEIILNPGDELFIPKRTTQGGSCIEGTRTILAFGGKRIHKKTLYRYTNSNT